MTAAAVTKRHTDRGSTSDTVGTGLELLRRSQCAATKAERQQAREAAIAHHLSFAYALARRLHGHGVPDGDLRQVAAMALIHAVDRFDVDRGVPFTAFAAPTILGELKRYFRDYTWAMRVPRRLQELALAVSEATDRLSQELGRSPNLTDLAQDLQVTREAVLEAMECSSSYRPVSLTAPFPHEDGDIPGLPREADRHLEGAENWQALRPLLRQLSDRERYILKLRFVDELTQTQIADRIQVSQMQVSRLLSRCLKELRAELIPKW